MLIIIIIFCKPSKKTRVGKKLKKLRKNGEANVPSGRPTQNCCALLLLLTVCLTELLLTTATALGPSFILISIESTE